MFRKTILILLALSLFAVSGALAVEKASVIRLPEGAILTPRYTTVGRATATPPGTCDTIDYTCSITFFTNVPDGFGDISEGMRFKNVNPNTEFLKAAQVLLYNFPGEVNDTIADLVVNVYSNAAGDSIPGALLASVTVPHATLISGGWPANSIIQVEVNLKAFGLGFGAGSKYHIAIEAAGPGHLNALLDDGSCGANRWVEKDGAGWHVVNVLFPGNDNNVHIYAVVGGSANIPALTTCGLIILALLLTGTAVWMFRKKKATVTA